MLTALLLAACHHAALPAGDPARPDVILVSIDTLRADHVGSYGYSRDTTPKLDALAASGARFEQAWSAAPWTLPSHATIMTGRLPLHHGAIDGDRSIAPDDVLLAEAFRDAGYATLGVVSTLYVSRKFGFDRGFDQFEDFGIDSEKANLRGAMTADKVVAAAKKLAANLAPGKPAFVFVHLYDAHYPYAAPSPWDEKFDGKPQDGDLHYRKYEYYIDHPVPAAQMDHQIAQYDEEIAFADDQLGSFLTDWRASRPAIVAVTADHGEEFGERGSWGHAHTLYPEVLHVPLIINGPGIAAAAIPDRVGSEDIAPTLTGLAKVPFPTCDGTDRSAQLHGGPYDATLPAGQYAETSRFDTLRMRWHEPPYDLYVDLRAGKMSMCDTVADPTCARDVARDHFDQVTALEKDMYTWLGAPWEARATGTARSDGVFAVWGQRVGSTLHAEPGTRFALFPPDAALEFATDARTNGPYRAFGGPLPAPGADLAYDGKQLGGDAVTLDAAQKKALEELGYVQ